MRWLLLLVALPVLGACEISPVVSGVPDDGRASSARYDDCRRVSRDYCKDVVGASDQELRSCVADKTYRCVSGAAPKQQAK